MKRIQFYALREDVLSLLEAIERDGSLQYIRTGNATSRAFESFRRGADIPNLGTADRDTGSTCEAFLVAPSRELMTVRNLRGADGVQRYCMDQLSNPDTVIFVPAGIWDRDTVICGHIGTASASASSQALMKRFSSAFNKLFTKVKAYRVGQQAIELLKSGKRLTMSAQSPREFDLTTTASGEAD